ncbi:cytochrome c biogenesis protein ResC [Geotalea uraniireducens]|uniref:Cytochrome c biogenesis protein ResC n=1 Tax=Geotalea uraniireducens TaxID=351604 RepID=A0ABM8ERJ6_9BACT|nr:cytochrome c biogenesis protein CcsA [Geotalea uraniireducens]BDV44899.1 cytochrome c biogenesis protein ResC [Geotalea uraniireducens]
MQWLLIVSAGFYLCGSFKRPLFAGGLLAGAAYLAGRGIALGRLPLVGPHDTLAFFSVSLGLMALPFLFAPAAPDSAGFRRGAGLLAALFALLALLFPAFAMPLPPVLRTFWFELHVALAFFAYALFGIGAVGGAVFLNGGERRLLDLQYRALLVGYSFFSASMVAGGIWGYYAWGTYWLWTPKELWTSILWLCATFFLHLRLRGGGGDRLAAWGGIVTFAVALFTYLGVSILMRSSHSF